MTTSTHSVRYANPDTNNFDTGVANTGSLTSPTLSIGAGNRYLKFDYFLDGECANTTSCTYDYINVDASMDNGVTWVTIQKLPESHPAFTAQVIDLAAYYSATTKVRFYFTTVDSAVNNFEGPYIDNIRFDSVP